MGKLFGASGLGETAPREAWHPVVGDRLLLHYSRAPTATLAHDRPDRRDRPDRPQCVSVSFSPPTLEKVPPPPQHMQLFVLGYGGKNPAIQEHTDAVVAEAVQARAKAEVLHDLRAPRTTRSTRSRSPVLRSGTAPSVPEENSESEADVAPRSSVTDATSAARRPVAEHPDAFTNAVRLAVRLGQTLSVVNVDAMTGTRSTWRAAYAATVTGGLSLLAILSAVRQFSQGKMNLVSVMVIVFYLMSAVTSWLFMRFSKFWGQILFAFRRQEQRHGSCPGLRKKLTYITVVLLGVAFVEHSLSEMNGVLGLWRIYPNVSSIAECLEIYYRANYNMVEDAIGYSPLLAPFLFFLNFVATFLWNFNDLVIILLGVSLSTRFRNLRESVHRSIGHTVGLKTEPVPLLGAAYWRSARRAYNALSKLARLLNETLSMQILVSFVNNLYFICMQLLRGFDDPADMWYQRVYILFSFTFLVARGAAVSLFAASVHDQSKAMQDVLYCVCSEDYDEEVYRFLLQVTSDDVAFSGCNMFKVTRSLLLTVAGTILTYEVVLVQLN